MTDAPGVVLFLDYARRHIVQKGFQHEIDWCQGLQFEDQTPEKFIDQYVWVVLCAAFKEKAARVIEGLFWTAWRSGHPDPYSFIKHPNKRIAIYNAMNNYKAWFTTLKNTSDKIQFIETLPYMGPALSRQLARNIGLDVVKPDRWLIRLAEHWGYETPEEMCLYIQKHRPELRIGTIDIILWRYCILTGELF